MDGLSLIFYVVVFAFLGVPLALAGVYKLVEVSPQLRALVEGRAQLREHNPTIRPVAMFAAPNLTAAKKAIEGAGNVLGAIGSVVSFVLKHWQPLALIAVVLIAWLIFKPFFGFVGGMFRPSPEVARARIETQVARTETKIATQAIESAERTHIITREVVRIVEQAESEISDAVSDTDPGELYNSYRRNYELLWSDGAGDAPADPPRIRGLLTFAAG